MIFFTQKVLRTMPGNWTFVIVTDREELDDQAYKEFAAAGVVRSTPGHLISAPSDAPTGGPAVRFTLIQKFRTEHGEHTRSSRIVMTSS